MSPRQAKEGRPVRLLDPIRHGVRCWAPEHRAIRGAGGVLFPRALLDMTGTIVATADSRRRVLIGWRVADGCGELIGGGDTGLWVDADQLEVLDS